MPRLLLREPNNLQRVVLTHTTLVGRHWQCNAVLTSPDVPLYWLEVRWMDGDWAWRCLGAEERTVGVGRRLRDGWRKLLKGESGAIRLEGGPVAELVDDGPPVVAVEEMVSGVRMEVPDCLDWVELTEEGVVAASENRQPLRDGECFQAGGKVLRLWATPNWRATVAPTVDLSRPGWDLTVRLADCSATFFQDGGQVSIEGEPVRLLYVYAQARLEGEWGHDGGWLAPEEVHALWVAVGGRAESPAARIGWERGKIKSRLLLAGVGGLDSLFDRRQVGRKVAHRLNTDPRQITLLGT